MQMLSANLPLLVFNRPWYDHPVSGVRHNATSVPYFDKRCGIIHDKISSTSIIEMVDSYSNFSPRDYILENHTLEKSAIEYVNIISNVSEVK